MGWVTVARRPPRRATPQPVRNSKPTRAFPQAPIAFHNRGAGGSTGYNFVLACRRLAALWGACMNINKMMKQAQQMQGKLAQAQAELAEKTVEVTAGGGKLTVIANGAGDVLSIKISPDIVDPADVEALEDLILTGVKQAITQGREVAQKEMSKLTAGMGLPPGLGL